MALENFTTYTEGDNGGVISVTSSKITVATVTGFMDTEYVYKDFGASHFNAINATFQVLNSSAGTNYPTDGGIAFTDVANAKRGTLNTTDMWCCYLGNNGTLQLCLARGGFLAWDAYNATSSTIYYLLMERSAGSDTATVKVYTDSGRTVLVDTLSQSSYGTGTTYRYCYGYLHHYPNEASCNMSLYVENLNLNEASGGSTTYRRSNLALMGVS